VARKLSQMTVDAGLSASYGPRYGPTTGRRPGPGARSLRSRRAGHERPGDSNWAGPLEADRDGADLPVDPCMADHPRG